MCSGFQRRPYIYWQECRKELIIRRIIDRFEGDFAILEDPETLETIERLRSELPVGAKEGDVLTESGDGVLSLDGTETEARAARIRERFDRLKAKR